jgi:hypothetical protein
MMDRTTRGFLALIAAALVVTTCQAADKVALLIDSGTYPALHTRLERYEADVESQFGVDLVICNDQAFESMTPAQVRSYISTLHYSNGVDGVILAGLIPYALWKNYAPGTDDKGINSFYYEDLDGTFTDTNADGYDDYHTWGSHVGPEVWVCWMRPPSNNAVTGLQDFLDKTHAYYTGQMFFNHRALAAAHADYDGNLYGGFLMVPRLQELYGSNVDVDGYSTDPVVASEYVSALQTSFYEICDPMGHANASLQAWDSGSVSGTTIRNMTGGAVMTFIYGCHSAAFNENSTTNIAMMYYMSTTNIGQAASGTSWSYGTEGKWYIYDVLKLGGYLGQGWMNLETTKNTPAYMRSRYGDWLDTNQHLWGDTLLGNPFVYALYEPPDQVPPELTISRLSASLCRLEWNKSGNYDLECSSSPGFASPTVIDVTDLTHYDITSAGPCRYFRLRAKPGHAGSAPPLLPAAEPTPLLRGNVHKRSGVHEGGNVKSR